MIYGVTLIILGILAAPSLLLSKKPNTKDLLDKITPYQGWIGLVLCFWGIWGIWGIKEGLLNIIWLTNFPVLWITWIASSTLQAVLSFILGYRIISKLVLSKNDAAKEKREKLLKKLAPIQGKLGLIGIFVGIWVVISNIMFYYQ